MKKGIVIRAFSGNPDFLGDVGFLSGADDFSRCFERAVEAQPDQASITERYTEEAVRFIRENREGPFFVYFAHMYVHGPIYVPERFLKQSRDGKYGAAVEHIDFVACVLFYELERLGLDRNTLVVFTREKTSVRLGG